MQVLPPLGDAHFPQHIQPAFYDFKTNDLRPNSRRERRLGAARSRREAVVAAEEEAVASAIRAAEIAEEARVSAESPVQEPAGGGGGRLVSPAGMVKICDGEMYVGL